jgi:hypothetical protein
MITNRMMIVTMIVFFPYKRSANQTTTVLTTCAIISRLASRTL